MKNIYSMLCLFTSLLYTPQIVPKTLSGGTEPNYNLPETIKPSPESFYRTQFGNVPANEFRGMQNLSIPLHTLKYGDINIPITLNYSKLGVKVNDIPNDVGMSWVLETGGLINRTINDAADELAGERKYFDSYSELVALNTPDGTSGATELNRLITQNTIDLEVDYFNFTYPGNSGSFYLDKNYKPILITDDKSCKIEFNNNFNDWYQFVVTDNSGIKYYFGGVNAQEETGNKLNMATRAVTSFFLTKIVDTKGNEVNYQYSVGSARSYTSEKIQSRLMHVTDDPNCPQLGSDNGIVENNQLFTIKTPITLNKIYTDDTEIIFDRSPSSPGTSKLNNFKIYYKGDLKSEFRFNYLIQTFTAVEERFFLEKIESYTYQNRTATKKDEYLLEYNNPQELPKRLSNSVDYLGYYNGINNLTLLPNTDLFGNTIYAWYMGAKIAKISGDADRRPSFINAQKGTLKSITYPSKGKSVFEYESIIAKTKTYEAPQSIGVSYNGNTQAYLDINGATVDSASINVKIDMSSFIDQITVQKGEFIAEVFNRDTNQLLFTRTYNIPKMNDALAVDFPLDIDKTVNYRIVLRIGAYCKECEGILTVEPYPNGYTTTEDAGLRLKRQYDTTDNNSVDIKRYYYTDYNRIGNIMNLRDIYKPYFVDIKSQAKFVQPSSCSTGGMLSATYYYLKSSPNSILYLDDINYNDISYNNVAVSYGGDNFEKGGEEKVFDNGNVNSIAFLVTPSDFPQNADGSSPDFSSLTHLLEQTLEGKKQYFQKYNGQLLQNRIFRREGNSLFVKQVVNNTYSKTTNKEIYNLIGTEVYEKLTFPSGVQAGTTTSNFLIGYYPLASYYGNLVSTATKEYFDNVPVNIQDDTSYRKLITTTSNTYDNPVHNRLTGTKMNSSDGSSSETTYQYAHEKGNQYLIDKNMIGIPLQTTVTQKQNDNDPGKTISKSEILYPTSQADANARTSGLALPVSVLGFDLQNPNDAAKAQTELTYDLYDNKGNILQYSVKGKPVTVIWGYNQTQPIAKIEGAAYNQVSAYVSAIIAASDADNTQGTDQSEQALIEALDILRNNTALSAYQITTYTYNPLIGVTSITPPSGIREIYKYDSANRLESVKDVNGNLLKEYQYRYKN
ncbi:hypothetical protein A4C53_RS17355 [Elizabethkingia anophelis]|uniref:hypothetical protein n=3 Tax=Elizabethkingia anophelis TaxID=1117645 RepID=UPI0011A23C23|nr:hypothetical protein [Elizabethkingia anophelis]EJG2053169.1 hypothetical protein [Elizabethkingia anophelis]EJG2061772.1 hypothetical protein [Elizabethkingia anophelis]EJG2065444.1 hypothetical protein [Elizabethkingia anophelis]EJG2069242.1 hypothetical protein [Elizabethkingia anophelis]EJG2073169.1 hypothetical protein [Elizabethkingia anophelis]